MDRLTPLDAMFVEAEDEDENTSMAIASIAVLEGPAPSQEEILALVESRLSLVPRYRQKLRTVPFRLGRPVWVDDPDFDLTYHIRRTVLPEPGGDQQLAALMRHMMSQRLDRDHPLWEYWVVEGLAGDRWALICKVHHCMVDGIGGADLYRLLTEVPAAESARPSDSADSADADQQAAQPPSAVSLIALAAADLALLPARQACVLSGAVADPGRTTRQAAAISRAIGRFSPSLWPAAASSLSGEIGKERRYAWAQASLDDVKTIKRELGGTVNDVVLAAISSGFRALLEECGDPGWSGRPSRCHSGKSSRSRPTFRVLKSPSTGWDADSKRSSPMSRSRVPSAPASRSSATTARSRSASPLITPRTRM